MVEDTCFGLLASNPRVCSGNGNCTYLNFCDCQDGWDGNQCQALTAIDIREVMFGFSITGPILAVIISILLCIPFIIYIRRRKKQEEARKSASAAAGSNVDTNSSSDRVIRFSGRGKSNSNAGDDIQRSPTHAYLKPHPFTMGRSHSERTDRSDDILIGKSKSPPPSSISSLGKTRRELSGSFSELKTPKSPKDASNILNDEMNQV